MNDIDKLRNLNERMVAALKQFVARRTCTCKPESGCHESCLCFEAAKLIAEQEGASA